MGTYSGQSAYVLRKRIPDVRLVARPGRSRNGGLRLPTREKSPLRGGAVALIALWHGQLRNRCQEFQSGGPCTIGSNAAHIKFIWHRYCPTLYHPRARHRLAILDICSLNLAASMAAIFFASSTPRVELRRLPWRAVSAVLCQKFAPLQSTQRLWEQAKSGEKFLQTYRLPRSHCFLRGFEPRSGRNIASFLSHPPP